MTSLHRVASLCSRSLPATADPCPSASPGHFSLLLCPSACPWEALGHS